MTPEGAALHSSQLQLGQVTSCPPGTILQTQPYPQYVYQLIGAPQIQPAQYSVIGFQPYFPINHQNQQITVQNSTNLQQTPVIPTFPALQALPPVQNQVPDFSSGAQRDIKIQPQINSFFNEVKKNVQLIAPKPEIQTPSCSESYSKQKKKKEDSKSKRQLNRFNGMSEEEIAKKGLPDYLQENLDIVFIGINPSMHAAWTGKYYDGPGNHFWQCLHLSGIVPENMTAVDDHKLLNYGIGFTNVVPRTTRGLSDLSKQEIAEGAVKLREKLAYWKPKIAVFNGKIIYEVYAKQKKFMYGMQPDRMPGTDIVQWVMPSSSARCALLPRASDKVPFYQALKKYSDFVKGKIPEPDVSEVVFSHIHSNRLSPKKFKEEFLLKQDLEDMDTSIDWSHNEEPEESQMPKLEPQVPWPVTHSHNEFKKTSVENTYSKILSPESNERSDDDKTNSDESLMNGDKVLSSPSFHALRKTSLTSSEDESDIDDEINSISNQVIENDSDSDKVLSNNTETNSECAADVFERLLKAPSKSPCKSPRSLMVSPKSPRPLMGSPKSPRSLMVSPTKELTSKSIKKRGVNESWQSSVPKRNRNSSTSRGDTLNVQCAPWGESLSTFDLSEDYVNDYLKEKAAASISTNCQANSLTPPGLLMISPRPTDTGRNRSGSLDLIPACVPESVGTEIEDIIQSGFTNEKSYNLDSELSSELSAQPNISPALPPANKSKKKKGAKKSNSGRSSPQKAKDRKNPRTKSTDDLPPNLLPEDYLDEVIGQYFNNDSSSEEEPRVTDKILKKKIVPVSNILSENSSDEDENEYLTTNKARTRPPASFFSMDFLDDAEVSDTNNENLPNDKIKTDLEMEAEYKHILYGGKKRKAPKIGAGKKRKKASTYKFPGEKTKKVTKADKPAPKTQQSRAKKLPSIEKFVIKLGPKMLEDASKRDPSPLKVTKQSHSKTGKTQEKEKCGKPSPLKEIKTKQLPSKKMESKSNQEKIQKTTLSEPQLSKKQPVQKPSAKNLLSEATPTETVTHTWKGKKASKKAYDRSKMCQKVKKPFSSSKIEDVTGRYSLEEELVTCGICELLDPPVDPNNPHFAEETTEWVGCDCYRWFHKGCTKLMKITEKFSCKSVKMKCIESKPEPVQPVLQIAILKFFRDRDVTFIEDVLW